MGCSSENFHQRNYSLYGIIIYTPSLIMILMQLTMAFLYNYIYNQSAQGARALP